MDISKNIPKLIISGITSGVGKTSITMAIMYGLQKKGYKIQSFKIGPDYIDPYYHKIITNINPRNLDLWVMGKKGLLNSFYSNTQTADIAIIEGVMGLFDGAEGRSDFASTAHISKILEAPIVLVVDASRAARSIAAIVNGFINFDRKIEIKGVILNKIAGQKHFQFLKDAFEDTIKIPILGAIKRDNSLIMEERHLGLIPPKEMKKNKEKKIFEISKQILEQIKIDEIEKLILKYNNKLNYKSKQNIQQKNIGLKNSKSKIKLAVALDESFNFYYTENFELLRKNHAELVFFSPTNDSKFDEDISGIILGGGFPEILSEKLEKNNSIKNSIKKLSQQEMPIYAECGGLMYLTKSITDSRLGRSRKRRMVGLIDAETVMTKKLTLNYTKAESNNNSFFGKINPINGHEFHYSEITSLSRDTNYYYRLQKGKGIQDKYDGIVIFNTLASYMHLHFLFNPTLPKKFVESSIRFARK